MTTVLIVGDGPGGLSAALLLAKNGIEAVVVGQDKTPMHYAQVFNYLGIPEIAGSEFQQRARAHAASHGATLHDGEVTRIEAAADALVVEAADGNRWEADYLVLAGGKAVQGVASDLGLIDGDRVPVDAEYRTSRDRIYAIGRLVRPERSQAIISAGAGATVALDILSREAGTDVHDWDTPPDGD